MAGKNKIMTSQDTINQEKSTPIKTRLPQAALTLKSISTLILRALIQEFAEARVDWIIKKGKKNCLCTVSQCDWTSVGLILCSCPSRKADLSGVKLWAEQEKEFWHPHRQETSGQGRAQKMSKCPVLLSHMGFVSTKIRSIQQEGRLQRWDSNNQAMGRPGKRCGLTSLSSPRIQF